MPLEIELIRREQLQAAKWSGGTTTQLAIYPKDTIYSEGNFKWRLSSAKVEVEESIFTSLPNIDRVIMIIEGELTLEHKGHHRCVLKPFDQDSFSGNWQTKSFGKVVDFNLMMNKGCEGELEAIHLEKNQSNIIFFDNKKEFSENVQAIYCVKGQIRIKASTNEVITLYEGDIGLIKHKDDLSDLELRIYNEQNRKADVIKASIRY